MISLPVQIDWQRRLLTIVGLLLIFVALGGYISSRADAKSSDSKSGKHVLTIYDGGTQKGIMTDADTLREAFEKAGIEISKNDITEPSLDEELVSATYEVNIYRSRPVVIYDEDSRTKIVTAYSTPKQIAKQAGIELNDEDVVQMQHSTEPLSDGAFERMIIDRATEFTLVLYGEKVTSYTMKNTVGEMLEEKDITVGEQDTLSVDSGTAIKSGMTVEIWRDGKQTVTEEQVIKKPVREIHDADRDASYREVRTPGKDGKRSVTYEIVMRNGRETSRKEISSVVTEKAVEEVVVIGTKGIYTGGPLTERQLNALGQCESGMNPTTNTGNGFSGAFQFMHSTWQNVAPAPYNSGYAYQAPLDAQKQAVQNLLSRSSIYTQFPSCARQMKASGIL